MDDVRVRDLAKHLHLQRQHLLITRLRQGERGHAVSSLPRCTGRARAERAAAGGWPAAASERQAAHLQLLLVDDLDRPHVPGGLLLAQLYLRIVALAQHLAQLKLLPAHAGSSASAELSCSSLVESGAQECGGARSLHHLDRGLVAVRAGVVSRPALRGAAADREPSARHSKAVSTALLGWERKADRMGLSGARVRVRTGEPLALIRWARTTV